MNTLRSRSLSIECELDYGAFYRNFSSFEERTQHLTCRRNGERSHSNNTDQQHMSPVPPFLGSVELSMVRSIKCICAKCSVSHRKGTMSVTYPTMCRKVNVTVKSSVKISTLAFSSYIALNILAVFASASLSAVRANTAAPAVFT